MCVAKNRILLIDDDQELAELLTEYLATEGYELSCCYDGITGLKQAHRSDIDLILLDVMMPGLNGFDLLKALGGRHSTPILMLTAKGDDNDRILGLELGADDYLAKPYNHRELMARIKAILRRVDIIEASDDEKPLCYNHVELNHATRAVTCHQKTVELTGTEYQLLTMLMENKGCIVTKDSLSQAALGRALAPYDRSIDMHLSNIRRKLLPHSPTDKIRTIRGAGYIFLTGDDG